MTHLLMGHVESEDTEQLRAEVRKLRAEVARLESSNAVGGAKLKDAGRELEQTQRVIVAIKKILGPLHEVLGVLFGEIEEIGGVDAHLDITPVSGKWQLIGARVGGKQKQIIDLLLLQNQMSVKQMSKAMHCAYNTADSNARAMREAGLLEKNGAQYSLKNL